MAFININFEMIKEVSAGTFQWTWALLRIYKHEFIKLNYFIIYET